MPAKDYRNGIITLIVLAIGIKLLASVGKGYSSAPNLPSSIAEMVGAIESVANLLVLGIAALAIILVPLWLSKRSKEKKMLATG